MTDPLREKLQLTGVGGREGSHGYHRVMYYPTTNDKQHPPPPMESGLGNHVMKNSKYSTVSPLVRIINLICLPFV